MATRPWVTVTELKAYSAQPEVQERSADRLAFDISRAELKVIAKTNNTFEDTEKYPVIPEPVKMAVILLSEAYAKNAVVVTKKQLKSETFDDYAYTAESSIIDIDALDLDDLLGPYVQTTGRGKTILRMRKL